MDGLPKRVRFERLEEKAETSSRWRSSRVLTDLLVRLAGVEPATLGLEDVGR